MNESSLQRTFLHSTNLEVHDIYELTLHSTNHKMYTHVYIYDIYVHSPFG